MAYDGVAITYELGLYYLQSRYYDPALCRFLNADAFVSTGQGELGNNMFAYCLNAPVLWVDQSGTRVDIWPILFEDHYPGAIHKAVQAHIIASGLVSMELYLPGVGFADIYNPESHEIWEIKHGGYATETQHSRVNEAMNQITKYISNKSEILLQVGHAGAFSGKFYINCGAKSYLITYETPEPGVILYFVQQMNNLQTNPAFAYVPKERKLESYLIAGAALGFLGGLAYTIDSICQSYYNC